MIKALLTIVLVITNLFGGVGEEMVVISGLEGGNKQVVIYEDYDSIIGYGGVSKIEKEESRIEKLDDTTMLEYTAEGIFKRYNYKEHNMEKFNKVTSYYIEDVPLIEIWEK